MDAPTVGKREGGIAWGVLKVCSYSWNAHFVSSRPVNSGEDAVGGWRW